MKQVIYKSLDHYCVTDEANYNAGIQNAYAIKHLHGFESAEQVVEYFCEHFGSNPEDFIIKE